MKYARAFGVVFAGAMACLAGGCNTKPVPTRTFQDDVNFLSRHVYTIVLTDMHGQMEAAVVPKFQGTVMTSTAEGTYGQSYGYIDYELIASRNTDPQFNMVGGEDRVFVGPSGGQFGIDFAAGVDFKPENLQVPAALDREGFDVIAHNGDRVTLQKKFSVTNYSNKTFQLRLTRTIRLLPRDEAWTELGARGGEKTSVVAYETKNDLVNATHTAWRKEEGLLDLSVVGMFRRTSNVALVLPTMEPGNTSDKRAAVGMVVLPQATVVSAEQASAHVALSPKLAKGLLGSYDPATSTLTVVQFEPIQPGGPYMRSEWQVLKTPYQGDAASVAGGAGNPFFMLVTHSPALQLDGWSAAEFTSRTYHIRGTAAELEPIARAVLGVGLEEIRAAVPTAAK